MNKAINKKDIFLAGKKVILKVLSRDDIDDSNWYGWFNDEELCKTLQKHYYPSTRESQIKFLETEINNSYDKLQLGICQANGGPIIGIVSLNCIDLINRKAEISILVGEREFQKIDLFNESINLMLAHAFKSLNLNRIYGGSISKELVELMCRLFNFREEGIRRNDVFKDGQYCDIYCFGLLRKEFCDFS
jgi:ribosomal-protein-alanine N-acetyltransferase